MRARLFSVALLVAATLIPRASGAEPPDESAPGTETAERKRGFRFVHQAEPFDRSWRTVFRLLGGLEGTVFTGGAHVFSKVRGDDGGRQTVASGRASNKGWSVATYGAPEKTGFFAEPRFGFLSQAIKISDFRADVPEFHLEGAEVIPANCRADIDGPVIPCEHPNVYSLDMKSGYAGANAGYALVARLGRYWSSYIKAAAGANLLEYRSVTATIADHTQTSRQLRYGRGLGAALNWGVKLLPAHLALRVGGTYDYYYGFDYGDDIQFYGPTEFNEELQTYRRPVVNVQKANLHAWSFTVGLAVTIF